MYLKIYLDDWKAYKSVMRDDQIVDLLNLAMTYMETGKGRRELNSYAPAVQMAAIMLFSRIDNRRHQMDKFCK